MKNKLTKQDLIEMSFNDIEKYFNTLIFDIKTESIYKDPIIYDIVEKIKSVLPENVNINYYKQELYINFNNINLTFSIGIKNTDKIETMSKLKSAYIKNAGKIKFKLCNMYFKYQYFITIDKTKYIVDIDKNKYNSPEYELLFTNKEDKIIDLIVKENILEKFNDINISYNDIKENIILNASQDIIKTQYFNPDFNQEKWNEILYNIEIVNKDLISKVIDDMLTFKFD